MFITISKTNDRYAFIVGDDPTDPSAMFIRSERDARLIPGAQPNYPTFREAHSHATQVVERFPSLILSRKASVLKQSEMSDFGISPEDSTVATLEEQPDVLDGMLTQIKGALDHEKKDRLDALLQSIAQSVKGVEAILEEVNSSENEDRLNDVLARLKIVRKSAQRELDKIAPEAPVAPQTPEIQAPAQPAMPAQPLSPFASQIDRAFAKDCLRAFGEAASQAIDATHGNSYLKYIGQDPQSGDYQVIIADEQKELCVLNFSPDLLLEGVFPSNDLAKQAAYYTTNFFERYWEPIVEAVGHYLTNGVVITPHHPFSKRRKLAGWSLSDQKPVSVTITIPERVSKTSQSWILRRAEALNAQEWEKAQVRCTKNLPSYYLRTGNVQSVINRGSYLDINVDFGRGLGIVTLTNFDLQKITNLS